MSFKLRNNLEITIHAPSEPMTKQGPGLAAKTKSKIAPVVGVSEKTSKNKPSGPEPFPVRLLPSDSVAKSNKEVVEDAINDGVVWGVEFLEAHGNSLNGEGVTIAILDTGINQDHEAFQGIKIETKNFTDSSEDWDTDGHGTHCAGTILGRQLKNGVRIGVAPGVERALIAKVIGDNAGSDRLMEALQWAVKEGADIISMSLGYDFPLYRKLLQESGKPEHAATSDALVAYARNVELFSSFCEFARNLRGDDDSPMFIAAAGNESERGDYSVEKSPPSSAKGVISVGAIDSNRQVAKFSNGNPMFVAPGVDIVSASHDSTNGLSIKSGTSMACPHVVGLAALYWQHFVIGGLPKDQVAAEVVSGLRNSAAGTRGIDFPNYSYEEYGLGAPRAPA